MVTMLSASMASVCLAGDVKTFVGRTANFSEYQTYTWLPTKILAPTGIVENDPVIGPAVRSAVNAELTARGLKEVPQGGDLQVSTIVLSSSSPQVEAIIFGGDYAQPDFGTPIGTIGRYNKEGTLAVNLIDSRTKKSAWAGMVTRSIDSGPAGSNTKKIAPAANKLFKKFPIKK
jgi:hypothetical protein